MSRRFAAFVRLSQNLAWRLGTLAVVFLMFSALGYMLRNGFDSIDSIAGGLMMVAGLQIGAFARACYLYHNKIPFQDLTDVSKTSPKDEEAPPVSQTLFLIFDITIAHPILGTIQPLLGMLLAICFMGAGVGRLVTGPGWEYLIGAGYIALGWLGAIGCWAALFYRLDLAPQEAWRLVMEQVRRLRR